MGNGAWIGEPRGLALNLAGTQPGAPGSGLVPGVGGEDAGRGGRNQVPECVGEASADLRRFTDGSSRPPCRMVPSLSNEPSGSP